MKKQQGRLSQLLFGYENNSPDAAYIGNGPGLLMLLGPFAIPFYVMRFEYLERLERKEKESKLRDMIPK